MEKPIFFKKKSHLINNLFPDLKLKKNIKIENIRPLKKAKKYDLTFFDSTKYKLFASQTKASFCITTEKLKFFLPDNVQKIIVKNVLYELAKILKKFYQNADIDYPDLTLKRPVKKKYKSVKFGNNVLVGKNAKLVKTPLLDLTQLLNMMW